MKLDVKIGVNRSCNKEEGGGFSWRLCSVLIEKGEGTHIIQFSTSAFMLQKRQADDTTFNSFLFFYFSVAQLEFIMVARKDHE